MPQPIDMQSELARTLAAERIQDAAVRAAQLAQQRGQIDAEAQRIASERQVTQSKEIESEGVSRDGRGRRMPDRSGKQDEGKEESGTPRRPRNDGEEHALDVTA